jgi:putative ABC transport system permease protein
MPRIPLAWLQLTNERLRLVAAVAGIAFAVILMLMQLGLRAALLEAAVLHYERFDADLFMMNPQYEYLVASKSFSWHRLYQALSADDVESVVPVYLGLLPWKDPQTREETTLLVMGFDPRSRVFNASGVEENLHRLEMPDVVLFDVNSHVTRFGTPRDLARNNQTFITEINGRRVRVGGFFRLGIGFATLGNVITSDQTFLRIVPYRNQNMIDLGLIRLKPGVSAEKVQTQLRTFLNDDVKVMTRSEFMNYESSFWDSVTPIGYVFGLGALMGVIVGSVIVYQILYTDVSDHLSEYATLKAIGYGDRYLFGVVLKEALLLSVLGYVPGFAVSYFLYDITASETGIPIAMTFQLAAIVFVVTVVMCSVSGALAMRRVRSADPAEVF